MFITTIIASTKTMVDFGSDQRIISYLRDLIEEKRFAEAKIEIDSFLCYLQKTIKSVKEDIEAVQEDSTCPDLEMVKSKIQQTVTASDELTTAKRVQMRMSHRRVFRLDTSTLVYTIVGAAAGLVIASCMPHEASKLTNIVTSAGCGVLTFYTGSVLTGLQIVMDNADLTNDLRRAESSIIEVSHCFTGFSKQLNCLQSDINSIEKTIDKLKHHMINLQEEVDNSVSGWAYVGKILQQMFQSFIDLNACVIDKSAKGFSEEFSAGIERLTHSVEVQGTQV